MSYTRVLLTELDVRAPLLNSANPGDTTITLTWQLANGTGGLDRDTFRVYFSTAPGIDPFDSSTYDSYVGSTDPNVILTDLVNATTYYFVVTELADDGQESLGSNEIAGTPNAVGIELLALTDTDENVLATDDGQYKLDTCAIDTVVVDTFLIKNIGTVDLTLDIGTLFITGDGSNGDPSAGSVTLAPGESTGVVVLRNTSTAGTRLYHISVNHDGADSPFEVDLVFDVTGLPGSEEPRSRIFRESRDRRFTRV